MIKYKFTAYDRGTMREVPELDTCEVGKNTDDAANRLAARLNGFVGGSGWTVFTKRTTYSPVLSHRDMNRPTLVGA